MLIKHCETNNIYSSSVILFLPRFPPSASIWVAFAELQTDMTDLTADLQSLGTPTLDHKTYVMKVFFPGVTDHPILNDPKVKLLLLFVLFCAHHTFSRLLEYK